MMILGEGGVVQIWNLEEKACVFYHDSHKVFLLYNSQEREGFPQQWLIVNSE
jgi:hypothetical protein